MTKKTKAGARPADMKAKKARKEKKPTDKLADKTVLTKFLQGIFGDAQKRVLKRLWKRANEITKLESKYEKMSDEELKSQTEIFKKKIDKALKQSRTEKEAGNKTEKKKSKKKTKKHVEKDDTKILDEILNDAFAVAREASKRVLGMRPYDVQLIGGMVLNSGAVAEMKTGEGKTLVAMLPA